MPVFEYKAMDMDSSSAAGTVVADTPAQARELLRGRGLTIMQLAKAAKANRRSLRLGLGRKARASHVQSTEFVGELATLLEAGIPLMSALGTLARQHKGKFQTVVKQLGDRVSSGISLAEAMSEHDAYFDEMAISIIRVGENTGSLEHALGRLAEFAEKAQQLRSRVTTALIYPAIVALVGVSVSIFLMTYVVPNLLGTLGKAGKELPAATQIVKSISDLLRNWWWLMILAVAGVVVGARMILQTDRGRFAFDKFSLRVPIIGPLIRKENTSRMAVVLAALLQSGLQFVEAIRITRQTVPNRVFRKALVDYEAAVTAGRDVAGPLEASGVFSPMVVQMLAIGQQAGQLEQMLMKLSKAFDQQVSVATTRLTAVIEPLLIVMLAMLVGFIAFATILPILEVSNVL